MHNMPRYNINNNDSNNTNNAQTIMDDRILSKWCRQWRKEMAIKLMKRKHKKFMTELQTTYGNRIYNELQQ